MSRPAPSGLRDGRRRARRRPSTREEAPIARRPALVPQILVFVQVPEVRGALIRAVGLGCVRRGGPAVVAGALTVAVIRDGRGNLIGLYARTPDNSLRS